MTYPDAQPHDPIKQLDDNLFVVHGSVKLMPIARITRNMAIVQNENELTLINPVRMDESGLKRLEQLGEVKHVLRLGPFHGLDDPFYVDRYKTEFWAFEGGTTYPTPAITKPLTENGALPFPDASLFAFQHLSQPEGAILLAGSPSTLLTCDSVQSYSTPPHMPHTNWVAKLLLPLLGFPNKTLIGPLWIKGLAEDKDAMRPEFERLLALNFDRLLSAHGTFVANNAHTELEQAFAVMFD